MGIYMGLLILGVILQYRVSASFGCFLMGCKELIYENMVTCI